jgi:hypothetical protein
MKLNFTMAAKRIAPISCLLSNAGRVGAQRRIETKQLREVTSTVELTETEKEKLWEEVRKEFPDDEMMQEIHYVRLLHHHQTKGLPPREIIQFFGSSKERTRA